MGKAKSIFLKIRNKTMMPTFTTFTQLGIGIPGHSNHTRKIKEIKDTQIGKEQVKLSLFVGAMILHRGNPK